MNLFRVLCTPGVLLLVTTSTAFGQGRVSKLDPLLRPFRSAATV